MPRGGYRKPANPAPTSGPGALSRRTDGGPTQAARYVAGGQYGEGQQLLEQQRQAPMAAAPKTNISGTAAAQAVSQNRPPIIPINAPTQRPNEPLTAGMPFGPGPGPEALVQQQSATSLSDTLAKIVNYDDTGEVIELYNYLISRGM